MDRSNKNPDATPEKDSEKKEVKLKNIPVVPLRGGAVFPSVTAPISIGRRRSLAAAQSATRTSDAEILVLVQYDAEIEEPTETDLAPIGILARVLEVRNAPNGMRQMIVDLMRRVDFHSLTQADPYLMGTYTEIEDVMDVADLDLMAEVIALIEHYAEILGEVNRDFLGGFRKMETAGTLADHLARFLNMPFEQEMDLFTTVDGVERLSLIRDYLDQEVRIANVRSKIQHDARDGAEKAQREFILREQMRAIRKELGEDEASQEDEMRQKIVDAAMPEKVEARALKEFARLERLGEQSAEAGVIRTYLEWLIELPWNDESEDILDIEKARVILDEDHYGLDDVKDRIIEYIAVRKLAGRDMKGPIINLFGPPGVGKTSIATSIARAMGREMIRISLGCVRDEAEIRGHRRTYIGAIPGRVIRALRDAGTRNPIIVLDEIDKVGSDWRGDPSSALLEVLDPEQNSEFTDHYLEVPFDLSQVIFITTSNQLNTIPAPLLDRMETIQMAGYIEDEKIAIAEAYLLPKQAKNHGIGEIDLTIGSEALRKVARHYTSEAGVRQLERNVGKLVRKTAVKVASGKEGPFKITADDLEQYLGPEKFTYGLAEEEDQIGTVTGLAVAGFGGDVLKIEVMLSEGKGEVKLTGSLGDVMRESAQAALTYARANAKSLGLKVAMFDKSNIHIHVPAGATPKDGPSAGIAMATAIISAFTRRPVRHDLAMTGEVTLRGNVLPIGGLKAKSLAAHRAGIRTILLPKDNAKDIPDLPEKIREDLELIAVAHIDEVLDIALKPAKKKKKADTPPVVPPPSPKSDAGGTMRADES